MGRTVAIAITLWSLCAAPTLCRAHVVSACCTADDCHAQAGLVAPPCPAADGCAEPARLPAGCGPCDDPCCAAVASGRSAASDRAPAAPLDVSAPCLHLPDAAPVATPSRPCGPAPPGGRNLPLRASDRPLLN